MRPKLVAIHHSAATGGGGRSLVDLVRGTTENFEVVAYVPESATHLASQIQDAGAIVKTFPDRMPKVPYYSGGAHLWHPRIWFYSCRVPWHLRAWGERLVDERPDVVVANSGVISWLALVAPRTSVSVLMVRETMRGSRRRISNRVLSRIRKNFDLVVYLSNFDQMSDALSGVETMVVPDASPNLMDTCWSKSAARAALGIDERVFAPLYVGGSNALKGADIFCDAVAQLQRPVHAKFAGEPPRAPANLRGHIRRRRFDRKVLKASARTSDRQDIEFVGVVQEPEVLFAAADVIVCPITQPHQLRPAYEAGFARKPVIASRFPHLAQCIADEKNGLTFTPDSATELASCMERLARDPNLASALGEGNHDHAMTVHDHATVYGRFSQKLLELTAKRATSDREEAR